MIATLYSNKKNINTSFYALSLILVFTVLNQNITYAQCYLDRHNTTWYDGWVSCEKKISPNPARGSGHWLLYSLGHRYVLGKSHFWNHNVPNSLNYGAKEIAIDYSLDGVIWNTYGNVSLSQATGENIYEGEDGPDLLAVDARYVLITVLETHGGSCAGISEVKIGVSLSTAIDSEVYHNQCISAEIYPNPIANFINVHLSSACGEKSIIHVTDASGRKVSADYSVEDGNQTITIPARDLPAGLYMIHIKNGSKLMQERVVKVD